MIKVLFPGLHDDHYGENYYVIDPLTSSVTLIQENGRNILIDSGAFYHRQKLLDALKKEGLKPEDINYVINTHYHFDHTGNNTIFKNAFIGVGQHMISHKSGEAYIYNESKNPHFPSEISDMPTPGHSLPHHSYIYRENGVTYVIAGDAISETRIREGILQGYDLQKFYESMMKVFEIADVIIPGHHRVIEGKNLKELRKIAKSLKSKI